MKLSLHFCNLVAVESTVPLYIYESLEFIFFRTGLQKLISLLFQPCKSDISLI